MGEQEYYARVSNVQKNAKGRTVQTMHISDEQGNTTRNFHLSEQQAKEQIENNFDMENGKWYQIKYLVPNGWRIGMPFRMGNNVNVQDYVYTSALDINRYGNQGLDSDDLHIFGIIVEEIVE